MSGWDACHGGHRCPGRRCGPAPGRGRSPLPAGPVSENRPRWQASAYAIASLVFAVQLTPTLDFYLGTRPGALVDRVHGPGYCRSVPGHCGRTPGPSDARLDPGPTALVAGQGGAGGDGHVHRIPPRRPHGPAQAPNTLDHWLVVARANEMVTEVRRRGRATARSRSTGNCSPAARKTCRAQRGRMYGIVASDLEPGVV